MGLHTITIKCYASTDSIMPVAKAAVAKLKFDGRTIHSATIEHDSDGPIDISAQPAQDYSDFVTTHE